MAKADRDYSAKQPTKLFRTAPKNTRGAINVKWLESHDNGDRTWLLSNAYAEVANLAFDRLDVPDRDNPLKADQHIFPVLYLYRHAVEIALKEIVELAANQKILEASKDVVEAQGDHPLIPLWDLVQKIVNDISEESYEEEMDAITILIAELDHADYGFGWKYAKEKAKWDKKAGKAKEAALLSHDLPNWFDSQHFRTQIDTVFAFLEGAINYLYERRKWHY